MKLFFDFFPVALFYAAFQYARANKEWAAQKATEWFGFMVSGGSVAPAEAPTVLATVVVVLALATQIGWLLFKRQTVSKILWFSLVAAFFFGGATIWFHNPAFIKWKFSIIYWLMGVSFLISARFFAKNPIKALIGEGLSLPEQGWARLNLAWVIFFLGMGCLNLFIAYSFSENVWFNFKLFGSMALTLAFALAQGIYLSRHMKTEISTDKTT